MNTNGTLNSPLMNFSEIAALDKAECKHFNFSLKSGFFSVAIDSRQVKEGALFFALQGAACDGHAFVSNSFNSGAFGAVVEASKVEKYDLVNLASSMKKHLIVTDNTLKYLHDCARAYLEKFPRLKKIGLTGSSGKTTTKEIAAAIISCEKNTIMNKGNLNSETGHPLSVFEVRDYHEAGVFELGMNRPGEISEMANILKPNVALVTTIGTAHIEFFGTRDNIFKEKNSIFDFLTKDDTALIPAKDDYAEKMAQSLEGRANIKYFGEKLLPEFEGSKSLGLEGTEILFAGEKIHFALPGKHNLDNAIAAIAIAKEINISSAAIKKGLESVKPLFGRLEILKGHVTVLQDCYNANLESTEKSIEFCDSVEWYGRKVYVIADMLELGGRSKEFHLKIAALLSKSKAQKIFLFGNEIKEAASFLENKKDIFYTNNMDELSDALKRYVQKGDLVLLKGSRGCALERLTPMLMEVSSV